MLLDHLVVDPEQKEGGGPLSDEQCMVVFAGGLKDEGAQNGSQGGAKEKAAGQLGGVAFHDCGRLIFRYFSGAYTIIHFLISNFESVKVGNSGRCEADQNTSIGCEVEVSEKDVR